MVHLNTENPDLHALTLTVGLASQLVTANATPDEWAALTAALIDEHTSAELANMLTGAAVIIATAKIL